MTPYIPEEAKEGTFYAIFGPVKDLVVKAVNLEYTCAGDTCDGSHGDERVCFGVEGSSGAFGTLACAVSSATLKVNFVDFTSRHFSKVFLQEALLGVSRNSYHTQTSAAAAPRGGGAKRVASVHGGKHGSRYVGATVADANRGMKAQTLERGGRTRKAHCHADVSGQRVVGRRQ